MSIERYQGQDRYQDHPLRNDRIAPLLKYTYLTSLEFTYQDDKDLDLLAQHLQHSRHITKLTLLQCSFTEVGVQNFFLNFINLQGHIQVLTMVHHEKSIEGRAVANCIKYNGIVTELTFGKIKNFTFDLLRDNFLEKITVETELERLFPEDVRDIAIQHDTLTEANSINYSDNGRASCISPLFESSKPHTIQYIDGKWPVSERQAAYFQSFANTTLVVRGLFKIPKAINSAELKKVVFIGNYDYFLDLERTPNSANKNNNNNNNDVGSLSLRNLDLHKLPTNWIDWSGEGV